jgi:hypothetical protein
MFKVKLLNQIPNLPESSSILLFVFNRNDFGLLYDHQLENSKFVSNIITTSL